MTENMKTERTGRTDENKATVRIEIRLSPKQAERLNTKVEQTSLTTSAFIRKKIGIR